MSPVTRKTLVCGHRGASGYAPENTAAAFRKALEQGADWIEFDVQLTADNEMIILHDDTLMRTTDIGEPRLPSELTLKELKALDAGSWFSPEYTGEHLPTLDEVLEEFGPKLGLNIEIKSEPSFKDGTWNEQYEKAGALEQKVAQAVARHNLYDRVIVSSFNPFLLVRLHAFDPKIKIGALVSDRSSHYPPGFDIFQLPAMTGAMAIHPHWSYVNEAFMERAREAGLAVNTWTVNDPGVMQRTVALGVDMAITNFPDLLRKTVSEFAG